MPPLEALDDNRAFQFDSKLQLFLGHSQNPFGGAGNDIFKVLKVSRRGERPPPGRSLYPHLAKHFDIRVAGLLYGRRL